MVVYKAVAATVLSGIFVASCVNANVAAQSQQASDVVAAVDDVFITRAELDREGSGELRRLYRQVEEVESRALDRLIDNALLEGEARRRGIRVAQLLESGSRYAADKSVGLRSVSDPVVERYRRRRQLLDALRLERSVDVFLARIKEDVDTAVGVSVGSEGAPVQVVEFADLSCGYSAALFKKLERLRAELGSNMRWTTIDVYGSRSGPDARLAARASRCGAAQGQLIELRKGLFEEGVFAKAAQDRLVLRTLAERVGLDAAEFMRCVDSSLWEAELEESAREARRVGVSKTPAVFINGRRLTQSTTLETMRTIAQNELSAPRP